MKTNKVNVQIGDLLLAGPFLLAPLAGISDGPFRRLCHEMGAAFVYSEMVSAKGLWYGDRKSFDLLRTCPEEGPIGFQLFGSEPEILAEEVRRLAEQPNVLWDVNMGCPVAKVVRNGEGSALMKTPELAARIVQAMVAASGKPVTVKMRMGWDAESINAVEMARSLEQAGAAALTVHGRTRDQFYSGTADWGIISQVKAAVKIPVFGSGDVFTAVDAVTMLRETSCDGVMIARGALGNPWIFRDAAMLLAGASAEEIESVSPTVTEIAEMFVRQLALTTEEKGAYTAVREMRKHVGWYFKGQSGVNKLKVAACSLTTEEALRSEVLRFAEAQLR
ncbi:MAG: tRNA dihydrouridine synthase DusB [Clostridiales Family XIII bacterium]|jgi:tRNA-dihydrouridine synthase B|nr:tRNA dihydrouridine synthase DusB [Clostridiales Family XIII bacterium]